MVDEATTEQTTNIGSSLPASKPRIFYGWLIVVGAVVGQYAAMAGRGQVNGVFLDPMITDLGWTRSEFTLASSSAFVIGGFAGLVIGPMVDKYGPRPLMLVGAVGYGGALLLTSQVETLWQFIALQIIAGGVGSALVGPLVVNVAVSRWFVIRRGWALAIGSMGVSLASVVMPLTMTTVVDGTSWRTGYVVLSALVFVPLILISPFMRRSPEDHGLLPDGRIESASKTAEEQQALAQIQSDHDNSLTRPEALRTAAIWLLVIAFGINIAGLSAMFVHGIPFMTEAGFTRTEAAAAFSVTGVANFASKFLWGWGLQRFPGNRLAAGAFTSSATGVLLIILANDLELMPLLVVAFIFFGIGFGGTIPISEFLWANYFGRRYLGAVRSIGMPFTVLFGSLGPIAVAVYFDATDGYGGAFIGLALVYALAGAAVWVSRRPTKPVGVAVEG
ncbi:MAG: MFS transporter [Dehalococcoidia bacterium]|jgi:MFS transporter, OFA family, oxalate/formate antiporter|nr:MFS transporter [Dehalococcoidia bacterium]